MIDIIDVGSGNIKSIGLLIRSLGLPSKTVTRYGEVTSETLILPGVGAAGFFMKKLRRRCLDSLLKDHVNAGGRVIGICLGFQVLTHFSEEDGGVECLGLLPAETTLLHSGTARSHNQWETVEIPLKGFRRHFPQRLLNSKKKIVRGRVFYNHTYGVVAKSNVEQVFHQPIHFDVYKRFSSVMATKNVVGFQFHPEKSQFTGLEIMKAVL